MHIQTDETGRIVATMEAVVEGVDGQGNPCMVEQDTTGFFEFDLPEDLEHPFDDYVVKRKRLVYSPREGRTGTADDGGEAYRRSVDRALCELYEMIGG